MPAPLTVMVVDDEPDLLELVAYNIRQDGHEVLTATNGLAALEMVKSRQPDVVVLDVMMPGLSGLEVARRLRSQTETASIPIVMLTARAEEKHELEGLDAGADDYISKPFSMQVLIARVKAVARRVGASGTKKNSLEMGPIAIDLDEHAAFIAGEEMKLTITEFRILAALISAQGKVLSRPALISRAIGPGVTVTERTIDVHVTSIRKKLGEHAGLIKTVRGVGYRASTEPETVEAVD
jgi:two-component system alkaline phosphatase synthesis response regulator PhoP